MNFFGSSLKTCMIGQEWFTELIYMRSALKLSWTVTVSSPVKKKLFTTYIFFRKLDLYTLRWCNLLPVLYSVTFLIWNAYITDDSAVPKVKSNYKIRPIAVFVMWYDPCRKLQPFLACFLYGVKKFHPVRLPSALCSSPSFANVYEKIIFT